MGGMGTHAHMRTRGGAFGSGLHPSSHLRVSHELMWRSHKKPQRQKSSTRHTAHGVSARASTRTPCIFESRIAQFELGTVLAIAAETILVSGDGPSNYI